LTERFQASVAEGWNVVIAEKPLGVRRATVSREWETMRRKQTTTGEAGQRESGLMKRWGGGGQLEEMGTGELAVPAGKGDEKG
jgi:hypothetical protein